MRKLLLIAATSGVSACSSTDHIGKPPSFTPLMDSREHSAMVYPGLPQRVERHSLIDDSSLWRGDRKSLLGDRRALQRGDILTVVIEIDDKAEISNTTSRTRDGSDSVSVPDFLGVPQRVAKRWPEGASPDSAIGLSSNSKSKGDGSVRRKEKLTLRVAATIVEVQPNGVLAIEGSQENPDVVGINHAQHFAIAKQLAKRWAEEPLQQRLLALVKAIPVETQMQIEKQLSHPLLVSAQEKERAAIKVQGSNAYSLYMKKLKQRPPAASRWALVESVDKQSGFSQIIIQARSVVIKEIKQQVKGWQPAVSWESEVRQDVLQFLFYAYRKTPNNELKNIADSFNQPELKQFYNSVIASIK